MQRSSWSYQQRWFHPSFDQIMFLPYLPTTCEKLCMILFSASGKSWEKILFTQKLMFMESDHGGKTSLTNSSSFAPRTLSSFLWTFINNTIISTLSLFDPLCYNHSNHPIQSPKYLICLQYKLSLLTKKLLWELNILGNLDARSYQLTLCNTYYISKHRCVETACFFLLFWYNFFSHWKCRNTKKLRL